MLHNISFFILTVSNDSNEVHVHLKTVLLNERWVLLALNIFTILAMISGRIFTFTLDLAKFFAGCSISKKIGLESKLIQLVMSVSHSRVTL